ncbi:hypothetical protein ACYPKM_02070 [Pseudomonas aeruginosa]
MPNRDKSQQNLDLKPKQPTAEEELKSLHKASATLDNIIALCLKNGYRGDETIAEFIEGRLIVANQANNPASQKLPPLPFHLVTESGAVALRGDLAWNPTREYWAPVLHSQIGSLASEFFGLARRKDA